MTTNSTRLLAVAGILGAMAGCAGGSVPEDHFYRLEAPGVAPGAEGGAPVLEGVLLVQRFASDALLAQRPLVFTEQGASGDLKQYNYHFWADEPPRLLQELTVDALRKAGVADEVVTPVVRASPRYELSGKVKRLEHVRGADGPGLAVAQIEFALYDVNGARLLWVEEFSQERPLAGASIADAVDAMSEALGAILVQLIAAIADG